jgi:hypothetical protein
MTGPNLKTIELKALVPTRNFEQSKRFYQAIGFTMEWASADLASFRRESCSFLLQKFYVPDHANNFVMSWLVEDADAWWTHISAAVKEFGITVEKPADRPWGLRDFPLIDPSGALWRIGQRLAG